VLSSKISKVDLFWGQTKTERGALFEVVCDSHYGAPTPCLAVFEVFVTPIFCDSLFEPKQSNWNDPENARMRGAPEPRVLRALPTSFEGHFSCFAWVRRRESISGHVWMGVTNSNVFTFVFFVGDLRNSKLDPDPFLKNQKVIECWGPNVIWDQTKGVPNKERRKWTSKRKKLSGKA